MKNAIGTPEYRLLPGVFAAALAPIGLFIFAWTAREDITWVAPTIGIVIYATCVFIVSSDTFLLLQQQTATSEAEFCASWQM